MRFTAWGVIIPDDAASTEAPVPALEVPDNPILLKAIALAELGFHVFPVMPNGKTPLITDFRNRASRDPERLRSWFRSPDRNIGISTSSYGDGSQALVAVDIDNKGEKKGDVTIFNLELEGFPFPSTWEQATPSGGSHLLYTVDKALRQGVEVLGPGVDIRSGGGYVVAVGSKLGEGKYYTQINGCTKIKPAPQWLVDRLGEARAPKTAAQTPLPNVDPSRARKRGMEYLQTAPVATEGNGGNHTTFRVAARLKDFGMTQAEALDLLLDTWNDKCQPPWDEDALGEIVSHAYRYGGSQPGTSAPEAVFPNDLPPTDPPSDEPKVLSPLDQVNEEYAVVAGRGIMYLPKESKAGTAPVWMNVQQFKTWMTNRRLTQGKKSVSIGDLWLEWPKRREYKWTAFLPGREAPPKVYNLWHGFAVEPAEGKANHPALDMWLEHALVNVCHNDQDHFNWLMGWFAHMFQKPWEKPLVALALKGKKGCGKNALVERVGHLLGRSFMVADNPRYLTGNFNGHLETNILFTLDEAVWGGDKTAESRLKGLITGTDHVLELKGMETKLISNISRVILLSNEAWAFPASAEERRFTAFEVGDGRLQDNAFFEQMRVGMEQGGYAHLLRYLLDFDLSKVSINQSLNTQALQAEKIESLSPVRQWWLDCLSEGKVCGVPFAEDGWPQRMDRAHLMRGFMQWCRDSGIRCRKPNPPHFCKDLKQVAPSYVFKNTKHQGEQQRMFHFPGIDQLRADWEHLYGETPW